MKMEAIGHLIVKIMIKNIISFYGRATPPPPQQLVIYLGSENLFYNYERIKNYNDPPICGHLCLMVLKKLSKGQSYEEVLKELQYVRHSISLSSLTK